MSRKIDRVNDLTVLSGDGEKVLVGGSWGKWEEKLRENLGEMGGKNWDFETRPRF